MNFKKILRRARRAIPTKSNLKRLREVDIISKSNAFDELGYGERSGAIVEGWDLIPHYVWCGEAINLKPMDGFDPIFYRNVNPDVASSGMNLFAHYLIYGRAEGRVGVSGGSNFEPKHGKFGLKDDQSSRGEWGKVIRDSGGLDADFYGRQLREIPDDMDLVEHYLRFGEQAGLRPCADFDPKHYAKKNPDVVASGANLFAHFVAYGAAEGRAGTIFPDLEKLIKNNLNPSRSTVVLALHEASQTGAPILGLNIARELRYSLGYNVVVISRRSGKIADALRNEVDVYIEPPKGELFFSADEASYLSSFVKETINPKYIIANSAVCYELAVEFARHGLPVVALVHEFSTLFGSKAVLQDYFKLMSAVVFPAEVVRKSAVDSYPILSSRHSYVIPQGRSIVPKTVDVRPNENKDLTSKIAPAVMKWSKSKGRVTVLGLGTVEWRKGVDCFVSTAVSYFSKFPEASCRFVWVGAQTDHSKEIVLFLSEQLARSAVVDSVLFLPETDNLDEVYANADILFVSSRLDPLPNVAIDAMLLGMPVVSFSGATGVGDLLSPDPLLGQLVVPYLDADAAADVIGKVALNTGLRELMSTEITRFAKSAFDMKAYVVELDEIGGRVAEGKTLDRLSA